MARKKFSDITVSPQSGMIHGLVVRAKLVLRLLADARVSPWAKLIPIGALIYVISPVDLIMGIPGLDAIDDAAVVGLGYYFFIEMCPPAVVQEHLHALEGESNPKTAEDDVIDAEAKDVTEKQSS
jgi:uncharacterized membrane protein YkvA (DUF1232 family)